jgi:hypothetical protein
MVFGPVGHRRFWGSVKPRRPPKPSQKVGGLRPPPFGRVFGAAGAARTPTIDDFPAGPTTGYLKPTTVVDIVPFLQMLNVSFDSGTESVTEWHYN